MNANEYLHALPIIERMNDANEYTNDVVLYDKSAYFTFQNNLVETKGLGERLDSKIRDLIRPIKIIDALNVQYIKSNVLTPLIFAESLDDIPWHITTQGILFTRASKETIEWIKKENKASRYGLHQFDKFWLPFSKDIGDINSGEIICIYNRRVAGWDGSQDRPVIELLGAGGHLPTIWDPENNSFRELDIIENLRKEFKEELGETIEAEDIVIFGGYSNDITHELVVLCGVEINNLNLINIQNYAIQNIDEDTKGIYLGTFTETIEYYRSNPIPFAGGELAAPYNFPNRKELMQHIYKYLSTF